MKKHIIILAQWFASRLKDSAALLDNIGRPIESQSKFVNLAPTDQADKAGVYSEALHFAATDARVFNIALTGPYGSGKSSIIQSFLKSYRRRALHISLAAFVAEADSASDDVGRQEIERSILQQMLFGADANKLPLSRFKRIHSPGVLSIFKSLFAMLGLLALWYLFVSREAIVKGTFFVPFEVSNWLNLTCFLFGAAFLWIATHHLYVASFGISLKGISLKNGEFLIEATDQESILNRHLDEIIYFFQSTKYELVVIEDLDRFDEPEIFVTLREINKIVNENSGVNRTVRFLYALRDDMFVNTDRTKFFEFIIPVIPIINTSNSIDMVLKQGKRLSLDERLDRQFLREVSRYLDDLRLIQNIFNEYAIYVANLESDEQNLLDTNKLLAILIYKNVYPRDFEQLHRGTGNLANILSRQEELIAHGEDVLRSEITDLEQQIETAERQTPSSLRELRQIYCMAIVEKLPANVNTVSHNGQTWIALAQLVDHDTFEELIEVSRLNYRNVHNQPNTVDTSNLQNDVDRQKSYLERKVEIENKTAANKKENLSRIRDIRSKISMLRTTKLNELLRLNANSVESLFDGFGEQGELARFLILEGHLDDTYYQYTSLFHLGRLSPNDNKFLIQIRAFVTPEPDFQIDNPKEVVAAMRDEDFRQSYILNVKLVDCLLSDKSRYPDQTAKFLDFLASEFENCEAFFTAYYESGNDVSGLLSALAVTWEEFVPTCIASRRNVSHVTQLLASLSEDLLKTLVSDFDELAEFVSANLPELLARAPELAPERLEWIGSDIKDLEAVKEHPSIVRFMIEKGLFELTIANLEYAYQEILSEKDMEALRTKNYTTLRSMNNIVLKERVERDFQTYLQDVLLKLEENSNEDASAVLAIVRLDNLDEDSLREFLETQINSLPSLENVPARLHATLFELNMIEPTWVNCLVFIESEEFEATSLVAYLEQDDVRTAILKHPIASDKEMLPLRRFMLEAAALSDDAYQEYARALPKPFKKFPDDLERSKLLILIKEGTITFTKDSLDALAEDNELQTLFVAANIDTYLADPSEFALDDQFREELLRADIGDEKKRNLIDLMDLNGLASFPERAAVVGSILDCTNANISGLTSPIARSLILNSKTIETQISLLNELNSIMSDDEVRQILLELPNPYCEITTGYQKPQLSNSGGNVILVQWLEFRGIISSSSTIRPLFRDEYIRVNLFMR